MNIKNPSTLFFVFALYSVAGIFLGHSLDFSVSFLIVSFFVSVVSVLVYAIFEKHHRGVFFIFLILCLLIGGILFSIQDSAYTKNIPSGVRTGTIISKIQDTSYGQVFIVKTVQKEKIRLKNISGDTFQYKDTILFTPSCIRPKNFETELGQIFDYETFLKKDSIYSICTASDIGIVHRQETFLGKLFLFSETISIKIGDLFKLPHSEFIGGILLGDKSNISSQLRNDFTQTGTIHVIALSGYNIAIVALCFQRIFLFFLRKRTALLVSAVAIILFVAMTGFSASAIRAGIMALIVVFAQMTYQKYAPLRALYVASMCMILYNPFYLLYDSSFHLSFLATYGVLVLSPLLDVYFSNIQSSLLRSTLTTSLGAYVFTFPYVLFFFQGISFTGIFVNMIILPLIPLLMLLSTGALLIGIFHVSLAHVTVFLSEAVSSFILQVIHLFARVPFGYQNTTISSTLCIFLYSMIFLWIYFLRQKFDLKEEI